MAVALAYDKIGSDIQALVEKAKAIAGKVNVS
jgi:hypothetical protein